MNTKNKQMYELLSMTRFLEGQRIFDDSNLFKFNAKQNKKREK